MTLTAEIAKKMYLDMWRIRHFEEEANRQTSLGSVQGALHMSCGEEGVAVGVCSNLRDDDYITGTHRSHHHCIAKGASIDAMMAELFGKATGSCSGKGGSMHIADLSLNILGANGIVAGGPPISVGAALAAKIRENGRVAISFSGDGSVNQGTCFEAMNLAVVLNVDWDHPDVFADRAAVIDAFEGWLRAPGSDERVVVIDVADAGGHELADRLADWGDRRISIDSSHEALPPLRLTGAHNAANAACVHLGPYGTRSSTIVLTRDGAAPRVWSADGPPCTEPLVEVTDLWRVAAVVEEVERDVGRGMTRRQPGDPAALLDAPPGLHELEVRHPAREDDDLPVEDRAGGKL